MIGDGIEIVIPSGQSNQLRIGANEPKNVTVHRKEIYERIQREQHTGQDPTQR